MVDLNKAEKENRGTFSHILENSTRGYEHLRQQLVDARKNIDVSARAAIDALEDRQ